MEQGAGTATRAGKSGAIAAWAALALAGGFLGYCLTSTPEGMGNADLFAGRYALMLVAAALLAAPICLMAMLARRLDVALRLAWGANFAYAGVLKAVGVAPAPWIAAALALGAAVLLRRLPPAPGLLVMLHAMGSLAAVYLALTIARYLGALEFLS